MVTLDTLKETNLSHWIPLGNLKKARKYLAAVHSPLRIGNKLTAQVQGAQEYEVEVEFDAGRPHARCSCNFGMRNCEHVGALLLKWILAPTLFTQKPEEPAGHHLDQQVPLRVTPVDPPPTSRPKSLPAWVETSLEKRQVRDRKQLEEWLTLLKLEDLRELARTHGWPIKGTRKTDVVTQIVDKLSNPDEIIKALGQQDQEHRQALWSVAILGAFQQMDMGDFERVAKGWGTLKRYNKFSTYIRHLVNAGLVLIREDLGHYGYTVAEAFIPRTIVRQLPPLLSEAIAHSAELQTPAAASELHLADPTWLTHTVTQLLVLLEQLSPPLRPPQPRPQLEKFHQGLALWEYNPAEIYQLERDGKLRNPSQLTLTVPPPQHPLLDEAITHLAPLAGDAERLEFIYHLMVITGLLQPGSPVMVWSEVKEIYLRQPEAAQRGLLARLYFYMNNWSELWLVLRRQPSLRLVRTSYNTYQTHPPTTFYNELAWFRGLVLSALAWLPDNRWISVADLLKLLQQVWPHFYQSVWLNYSYYATSNQTNRGAWHLVNLDKPLDGNRKEEWLLAQGEFIRALVTGPLHWLGLVDFSTHNSEVTHVRLRGLGDLFWDRVETLAVTRQPSVQRPQPDQPASQTDASPLTVEEDQIRVSPTLISGQAHSLLDHIAHLEVAQPQEFVYRLDPKAVHQTFEAGGTLTELLESWELLLSKPVPEPVQSRLTTWWQAYGQVRLYQNVTLIEFGDDYALTEMKTVTSLNTVMIAEISPRLVLIPRQAAPTLAAELEKAGYMPRQTDATE